MISIIVPVYNVEKYLKQCLDSLVCQTYQDIEVIMIDDGSTDSSGKICDEYAQKYPNFFVYHKENEGLGMARNTGLKYITGGYVTFVDSDDYLQDSCIEILYKNLIENHVDMCKGGFQRIVDSGKVVSIRRYENMIFEKEKARNELLPRMIGSSPSKHDSVEMCVCGALYNVQIIKDYKIQFPSEREYISEDLVFNIDYMQHANGACTIQETGYCYRVNMNSLSTSYRSDRFEASKFFYLQMKEKLENLHYDENTIFRLQRMFFIYIRMSISQENKKRAKKTRKECLNTIKSICNDTIVKNIIRDYQKDQMGIKQKIFLMLIRYKMVNELYFFSLIGIL